MSALDGIKARIQAATPGPWKMRECSPCTERGRLEVNIYDEPGNLMVTNWCDDDEFHRPDADLIANAPTDIARLVAAVEAVERTAKYLDTLADGDRHYAKLFRQAVATALAGSPTT